MIPTTSLTRMMKGTWMAEVEDEKGDNSLLDWTQQKVVGSAGGGGLDMGRQGEKRREDEITLRRLKRPNIAIYGVIIEGTLSVPGIVYGGAEGGKCLTARVVVGPAGVCGVCQRQVWRDALCPCVMQ